MTEDAYIKSERILFFHIVKACAILGIYGFHYYARFIGDLKITRVVLDGILHDLLLSVTTLNHGICFLAQVFLSFGNIGVDLFFIASGFGLYYSYMSKRGTWTSFYKRRFVRVLPLYYVFLFLVFFLAAYVSGNEFYSSRRGLGILIQHVLLVQTFSGAYVYYGLFYFIALIVQMYLLFPFLVQLMEFKGLRFPLFLLFFLSSFLINKGLSLTGIEFKGILLTNVLPLFFFGMITADSVFYDTSLYKFLFQRRHVLISLFLIITIVYFCVVNSFYSREIRTFLALLVFISLSILVPLVKKLRVSRIVTLISCSSYVFYLCHMIFINRVLMFLTSRGIPGSPENMILAGALTLPLAMGFSFLLQKGYNGIVRHSLNM